MTINLEKGARINLEKGDGSKLTKISMGLGWDPVKSGFFGGGSAIDLDASCLMLDANKQLVDQAWFRQLKSKCGSVVHTGDNVTGEGDGDDETINVNLEAISENIKYLVFTVNSFRGQTFKDVANATANIYDDKKKVLATYTLSEKGSHTGMIMVCVYRHNGAWKVNTLGHPTHGKLATDMMQDIVSII